MYILSPDNKSFDTARIPSFTKTVHFCVLDHSESEEVDYKFPPMVFIEDFSRAAAELQIADYVIQVPLHWCLLIGDREFGDLELLPLYAYHRWDYQAFVFNPVTGYMPNYETVKFKNIYQEVKWTVPTIKAEHLLAVPLCGGENPPCVFFSEPKNKLPDQIDVQNLI